MDAQQALAELVELSSQVRSAVVLGADGDVLAATGDSAAAEELGRKGIELSEAAQELHAGGEEVTRVEVELEDGALFVVRAGGRSAVATTGPQPTSGLVVYDLRTCLDRIDEAPKPRRRRKTAKGSE